MPGRSYLARVGTRTVPASITAIKHKIDVEYARAHRGPHARTQRHRLLQYLDRATGRVRPLCGEPQDRRLHHHRPLHQPHGRRRHDRVRRCAAPPISIGRRCGRQGRARRAEAAEARHPLVHRPLRRRQIDHRQHRRTAAASPPAITRCCSTATTSATASTATSASPRPTGWRTSAASARWRS